MSLINDALKRAQEAQRPSTSSGAASIRSIDSGPQARPLTSRLLVVAVFLLLAAAFVFIGVAMIGHLVHKPTAAPPSTSIQQPVAMATASSQPVAAAPVVAAIASHPAAAPVPSPAPVVAAPLVMPPPPLVLPDSLHVQGIAYDPVRPWAIVSGRTVYVGDLVKGVRVMAITQNTVTFGSNGLSNLLYVGQ
jgi:hypothetical protein